MRTVVITIFCVLFPVSASATEWVKKPSLTHDAKAGKWYAEFELDSFSDVEVAIVDPAKATVVRHLAAGVLGPKAPPPFVANSRYQKLEWDGMDDYRARVAKPEALAVRVPAGMSVALEQIVGGDPYAYFSEEMGHNDHSPFGINGLELKSDGKVYVLGHSSNLGPPALRQYDIDGNYLRTIFPPPAGKDVKAMKGWGINVRPDGTYTPKFSHLTDPSLPSLTTTFLDTGRGGMARLFPMLDKNRLSLWHTGFGSATFDLMAINTDGTIPETPSERLLGPLVKSPPLGLGPVQPNSHVVNSLLGPVFTCLTSDGKSFYLSGVYAATTQYGSIKEIKTTGPWRDGQVWKVDLETRTAKVFFSLEEKAIAATVKDRKSSLGGRHSYAMFHGVAVDKDENVFLCDRQNKRLVVLDRQGKVIREIPVEHPDAVALSTRTGALYLTTRFGDDYSGRGHVNLVKFTDWRKDDKPAVTWRVSDTGYTGHHKHSYVVVCDTDKASNVWVAYTEMPVRIYRDDGKGMTLLKDFYRVENAQRCLGFDRMEVDQRTEEVYVLDDHTSVWKVGDWKKPRFVKVPLKTASIAIDSRNRHIYTRTLADGSSSYSVGKVARFHLDRDDYPPANFGDTGSNRITPAFHHEWCFTGNGDKGIAVAPNGNLAVVGDPKDGLRVFAGSQTKVPWEATTIAKLPATAGGVRFDLQGNLYVGYIDKKPTTILPGFEGDRFAPAMGRIHKYAPTGTLESGNLFPKMPAGPSMTYDVPYGAFDTDCIVRGPRFGVDGFGRIYYPTNIAPRVAVMDNAGNEILHFGTYGNRDSMGGLPGDLVPTKGIPLGFPNSVEATDNYIYVADMVNLRLLRLKKLFQAEATSR